MSLALRALPREDSELNVQRMLVYMTEAYWQCAPAQERRALAQRLESVLRAGLEAARPQSLKSSWFSALRDCGETPATVTWLTRVWKQQESVAGLSLSENDYIRLAEELAVRGIPDADAVVEEQIARTKNPDRKAQLEFVRPALASDAGTRDRWFGS